jgi:hypothetical protein
MDDAWALSATQQVMKKAVHTARMLQGTEGLMPRAFMQRTGHGNMRIHYLQHVPFEGPAAVGGGRNPAAHLLTATRFSRTAGSRK